jgi:hypothetical protein
MFEQEKFGFFCNYISFHESWNSKHQNSAIPFVSLILEKTAYYYFFSVIDNG